jgi:hypothetical protein
MHLAVGVGAGLSQLGLLVLRSAQHLRALRTLGGRRRRESYR